MPAVPEKGARIRLLRNRASVSAQFGAIARAKSALDLSYWDCGMDFCPYQLLVPLKQ